MAINNCSPARIFGPPVQTIFMGASVKDFTLTQGWNEQPSNLTVNLVYDDCPGLKVWWDEDLVRNSGIIADPGFIEPEPGQPVYFRVEEDPRASNPANRKGIEYAGIIQSYSAAFNAQGNPIYTVQITDPRQVLQNTQVIVNEYADTTSVVPNLLNAYAFAESEPLGGKYPCLSSPAGGLGNHTLLGDTTNARGMTWNDLKCAIHSLTSAIGTTQTQYLQGGRVKFVGGSSAGYGLIGNDGSDSNLNTAGTAATNNFNGYMVDVSDIPFAPTDYRISGPNISIMEMITQVCADAGLDFYVEYQPTKNGASIYNIIKIRTASRSQQPPLGKLNEFILQQSGLAADANGGIIAYTSGLETRNEDTSIFLYGGKQRPPLEADNTNMLPYFGLDNDGSLIQATIAGGEYRVRLDVRRLNVSLYTSFASSFIWVSESELRAALGDMDAWKHVTIFKDLDVADHLATIKQAKFLAIERIQKVADGDLPAHGLEVPGFDANNDDADPNNDSAKDITKIYDFIKSFADEFYGKQFLVNTDFVCYANDGDFNLRYSHEPSTEGCWVDSPTIIGLANPSSAGDFFTSDDGRYQAIVRYPYAAGSTYAGVGGALVADPSNLGDDNYITNGVYIWQKADLNQEMFIGTPLAPNSTNISMLLKVGAPVYNQTSEDTGGSDGVDQPQGAADFLARGAGGAGLGTPSWRDKTAFSLSMMPNAISPDAALVPILSNVTVYGPWGYAGLPGQTRVERDESFVPWEFGSSALMNLAAVDKASNATTQMRKGERGTVQVAGLLGKPLGSELMSTPGNQDYIETRTPFFTNCSSKAGGIPYANISKGQWTGSNGPNITNINVNFGAGGFTTEYQFSTYTPRFGRFDKDNADRLKQIGQNRLSNARNQRARSAIAQQITAAVASIRQRVNDQLGKTARAPKSASHMFIGGFAGGRNESFTLNAKEATQTFPSDAKYAESALMSMDGIIRPVSKGGDGGFSPYANHTTSTCSGNISFTIAPDGPKLTYSGMDISQTYLDPVSNPGSGVSQLDALGSGHDIEILGRDSSAPASGWAITENEQENNGDGGYNADYRFFAMRGPLMLQGWGYDTAGKPVPNKADSDASAEAGTFITSSLQDKFLDGFLKKPKTWPVAPVDLRLDRKRGVWTVPPPPRNLHVTPENECLNTGSSPADVNNGQTQYDELGSTVQQKIKVEQSPWDVQMPKDVGKIPVYYDTSDCKYYPFPVNRLDVTVSGLGGVGSEGYVDRFSDVKHLVFASGFSGVSLTSGCDNTIFLRVQSSGVAKVRWEEWRTDCTSTECDALFPSADLIPTSCSGVECTEFSTGLIVTNLGGVAKVEAINLARSVDYTCSEGSFTETTGDCSRYTELIFGSGLEGVEEACRYKINAKVFASGNQLDECVNVSQATSPVQKNITENNLGFVGYLSTTYDTENCKLLVSGVEPTIEIYNSGACGGSLEAVLGRAGSLVAGSGMTMVRDGCTGVLHTTLTASGFGIPCDNDFPYGTRTDPGQRRIENLNFRGNLSSTYNASDCSITVSGVPRLEFYQSGVCASEGTNGDVFGAKRLAVASGLKVERHDGCGAALTLNFGVSGQPTECQPDNQASSAIGGLITGINFADGLAISEPSCGSVTVYSRNYISGIETCHNAEQADEIYTGLVMGTGLVFKTPVSLDVCKQQQKELHVQIYASGSQFAGDGTNEIPDYYDTNSVIKRAFEAIHFTGSLATSYIEEADGCKVLVSGYTGDGVIYSGYPWCEELKVPKFKANETIIGTGIRLTNNGDGTATLDSPFFVSGLAECHGKSPIDVSVADSPSTGIIFGRGLTLTASSPGSDQACFDTVRVQLYGSGFDASDNLQVDSAWDSIQFTGSLRVLDNAADPCTLIVSGTSDRPGVTGSLSPCQWNNDTQVSDANSFIFGTGLSTTVDPNDANIVHVNSRFYVSGDGGVCGGTYMDGQHSTGIIIGAGLKATIGGSTCDPTIELNFRGFPSGTCGDSDGSKQQMAGLAVGTGLKLTYDDCTGILNLNLKAQGHSVYCGAPSYGAEKLGVTKFRFGTGLTTGISDCEVTVHAVPLRVGNDLSHGCTTSTAASTATGILFGSGLHLELSDCGAIVYDGKKLYGTDRRFNSTYTVAGSGFRDIRVIGDSLSVHRDGCEAVISGIGQTLTFSGLGTCGNPNYEKFGATTLKVGQGLLLENDGGAAKITSPFTLRGIDDNGCGTIVTPFNVTGISFGSGLELTEATCSGVVRTNLRGIGVDQRNGGNTAVNTRFTEIVFVSDRLSVHTDTAENCKVYVSGLPPTIAVTGSDDPCTWAKSLDKANVNGFVFGTGLKTTEGPDNTVHVNARFYASGDGGVCGGTYTNGAHITGIVAGKGLKVNIADCTATFENSLRGFTSGTCGDSDGPKTEFVGLAAGTGLSLTFDGCTGVLNNTFTVAGQLDKCVDGAVTYGNAKTTSKLRFGSGLITGVDNSCEVTVAAVPFKLEGVSDKGCGTTVSPFITTGIQFGSGLRIYQDGCGGVLRTDNQLYGTDRRSGGNYSFSQSGFVDLEVVGCYLSSHIDNCKAVISGIGIAVTGSTDPCSPANDTVTSCLSGIVFGTGLRTTALDDSSIHVNSIFKVQGQTDPCVEGAITYGDASAITGIKFGSGIVTGLSDCELTVAIRPFRLEGIDDNGCGTVVTAFQATGISYGSGIELEETTCGAKVRTNLNVVGTDKRNGGSVPVNTRFTTINVVDDRLSVHTDSAENCKVFISGLPSNITVTGSTDPCTLGADVVTTPNGITFSSGLKTILSADGVSVSAPFSVSGDGGACRGEYFAQSTTTGLVIGKGLKASSDASCSTLIESNIFASGGATLGGALQKLPFNAIQFTGNLVVTDEGDGCTVTVSGTPSSISVTGSDTPCSVNTNVKNNNIKGFLFGTGIKISDDNGEINVNSPNFVEGISDNGCGTTVSPFTVTGMKYGSGLELTDNTCQGILRTNLRGVGVDQRNGGSTAVDKRFTKIEFISDRLSVHEDTDNCTVYVSGKPAQGTIALSGLGTCGSNDYLKQEGIGTLRVGTGLLAQADGSINSIFYAEGIADTCGTAYGASNITGLQIGDGLRLFDGDASECNKVLRTNLTAFGSYVSTCDPDSRSNAFSQTFTQLQFTGYLHSWTDGNCKVYVSGKPTPITLQQAETCGEAAGTEFEARKITLGTGLFLEQDGCDAKINSNILISGDDICYNLARSDDPYGDGKRFEQLVFGSGLTIEKLSDCRYRVDSDFMISGQDACGANGNSLLVNSRYIEFIGANVTETASSPSTPESNCGVIVDATKYVANTGGPCHPNQTPVAFETLMFSGLEINTSTECRPYIKHIQLIEGLDVCGQTAVDPKPFEKIAFGSGLRVVEKGGCNFEVQGGIRVSRQGTACGNDASDNYYTHFIMGDGVEYEAQGDCSLLISVGLSGTRFGTAWHGQQNTCNDSGTFTVECADLADCGGTSYDGPYTDRGLPDAIRGVYTGPGIGAAYCGCDLILFSNLVVDGFDSSCDSKFSVQNHALFFGDDFEISEGNTGANASQPIDGSDWSSSTNIAINEKAGCIWGGEIVTGIRTTSSGGYITSVTELKVNIGGTQTCATTGPKYWLKTIPADWKPAGC